jgi:hypothetical protein
MRTAPPHTLMQPDAAMHCKGRHAACRAFKDAGHQAITMGALYSDCTILYYGGVI